MYKRSSCRLFAIISVSAIIAAYATDIPLAWDDPDHSDRGCTFPTGIVIPQQIYLIFIQGLSTGYKFYLNMASSGYYRYQHQKVTNSNFSTIADIKTLKTRIVFPYFPGFATLSNGKAYFFDSEDKYYTFRCIPLNLSGSNATCQVTGQSAGSKPSCFGTGCKVATTIIYCDDTSFVEYHCFERVLDDGSRVRDTQIFDVVSLTETLRDDQIAAITNTVTQYGFDEKNIIVYQDLV